MTESDPLATEVGLRFEGVCVSAGDFVLANLDFEVPAGAYAIFTGVTGSGKTTILESACGLREIERGVISLGGRRIDGLPPAGRHIGYVPQDGALFPTMTARRQIGLPLEIRGVPAVEIASRVEELSELVEIAPLLDRRPDGYSGGERQRVAIARAIAWKPQLLLMDEPIGALDERMRERVIAALRAVHDHAGVTTIHVTHDPRDVAELATCRLSLEAGKVRSC